MPLNIGQWDNSRITGVNGQRDTRFNDNWIANPDIAAQASMQLRNQKDLLGFKYDQARNMMGQMQSSFANTLANLYAGAGPAPNIGTGPVWDPGQVQRQVNAARAGNDAATSNQIGRMQGSMGARGFGTQSPLAMALQQRMQADNLATNTDAERNIRWDSAKGNAQQLLASQKAAADSWHQYQQEQIARAQIAAQQQNILTQAMFGLLG